jgi:hypothetical protein
MDPKPVTSSPSSDQTSLNSSNAEPLHGNAISMTTIEWSYRLIAKGDAWPYYELGAMELATVFNLSFMGLACRL